MKEILRLIDLAAIDAIKQASDEVIVSAMLRTPSIDEEYNILMAGTSESPIPRSGGSSDDADAPRQRLLKNEETYLANVVPSTENREFTVDENSFTFRFGNLALLEEVTHYSWTDLQRNGKRMGTTTTYTSNGSYFNRIEYGGIGMAVPRFGGRRGPYPLRPDYENKPMFMYKAVRSHRIFSYEILQPLFANAMVASLKKAGPGHGS